MTDKHRIAAYIRTHPRLGPHAATAYARPWPPPALPYLLPSDELAEEFLQDAEFAALELGTWLGTTDGQEIAEAVSQVIPRATSPSSPSPLTRYRSPRDGKPSSGVRRPALSRSRFFVALY